MPAAELVSTELRLAGLGKVTVDSDSLERCSVEADTIDSSSVASPSFKASASTMAIHKQLTTARVVHKPPAEQAVAAFSIGLAIRKVPTTQAAIPNMVPIDTAASGGEASCKAVSTQFELLGTWSEQDQNSTRGTATTTTAGVIAAWVVATASIEQAATGIIAATWEDVAGIVATARQLASTVGEAATAWVTRVVGGMLRMPECHQQVAGSRILSRGLRDHTARTVGSIRVPGTHL